MTLLTTTTSAFQAQPSERAPTEFQSVGNAPASYNGYVLMVTAYALIWVILMVWLLMMWQKSRGLAARIADLDLAIDRAAAKAGSRDAATQPPRANVSAPVSPDGKRDAKKDAKKDDGADGPADS